MKLLLVAILMLSFQQAYASDAFSKKCIELGGESSNHGSCVLKIKVESKVTDPHLLISSNEYMNDQKELMDKLGNACEEASLHNPDALMSTDFYVNDNTELNINAFCFISID